MAVTTTGYTATTVVAATYQTGSAPTTSTDGYLARSSAYGDKASSVVRTFFTYAGSVTACNVRLYTRSPGSGTAWFRGISTNESGYPLAPASGDQSQDWEVGSNTEFYFVVESISPGTSGNTVAISAVGVEV